mgnify:FL=1
MRIINDDVSISEFDGWCGANETRDAIVMAGKEDEFDELINDMYPDGITETQLNDILRFEADEVLDSLGITEDDE